MSLSKFVSADMVVCDLEAYEEQYAHQGHVVLHAAKEPYHRSFVGYRTPGAPKNSPEYLWAQRGCELALNMVDTPRPEFFSPKMILKGLEFLWEHDRNPQRESLLVLHCNEGRSRGPGMALLYLALVKRHVNNTMYSAASQDFRDRLYPDFMPGEGLHQHLSQYWSLYQDAVKRW